MHIPGCRGWCLAHVEHALYCSFGRDEISDVSKETSAYGHLALSSMATVSIAGVLAVGCACRWRLTVSCACHWRLAATAPPLHDRGCCSNGGLTWREVPRALWAAHHSRLERGGAVELSSYAVYKDTQLLLLNAVWYGETCWRDTGTALADALKYNSALRTLEVVRQRASTTS